MIHPRPLFFLMAAMLASPAHGGDARLLAWDESVAARKLAWVSGDKDVPIKDLHPLRRSHAYPGNAPGTPLVIRALDRTAKEGEPPVTLSCSVPVAMERPLILLVPDEAAPSGLKALVIDDSEAGFAWGTIRFLNVTPEELYVLCDKKAVQVPKGLKPVDVRPGGGQRNIGIRIDFAKQSGVPVYTSLWEYRDDTRSLVFVTPSGDEKRLGEVGIKVIPESK
ncbi:hypothetical protein KBB96_10700 [Luteolibacter ambystomatis]|uniref:Uncharacterized protein n=1 Tax=Luteolibacter ambystomatis TaxID=2824561 RepID=A0A975G5S1_9BACT|nr:hypothetical protein [Luteolibacter ambystomatis]QUE49340.1 hypothetical protein KBB96_10700 [Luteolibacter ambystomatis]